MSEKNYIIEWRLSKAEIEETKETGTRNFFVRAEDKEGALYWFFKHLEAQNKFEIGGYSIREL